MNSFVRKVDGSSFHDDFSSVDEMTVRSDVGDVDTYLVESVA